MSQRLRGAPSRKSNIPRVVGAVALVAGAVWIGIEVAGGGEDEPSSERGEQRGKAGVERPDAQPEAGEGPPTAEEKRQRRAEDGRVGVFDAVDRSGKVYGKAGPVVTYSVVTEQATGVRPREFARDVDTALGDPRSWTADGAFRFERVIDRQPAVRIVLATPATVDELCLPLETMGQFSCRQGSQLNINLDRWLHGTDGWPLSLAAYRNHVINHEMGHFLGKGHVPCPAPGAVAPVMMQQTKDLGGCKPNPWPFP